MKEIFEVTTSKTRILRNEKLLGFLISSLEEPFPKILSKIVNLKIFMKDNFDDNCVKCILRMRKDLEVERRHQIVEVIKKETSALSKLREKSKQDYRIDGDENRKNKVDLQLKKFFFKVKLAIEARKQSLEKKKKVEESSTLTNIVEDSKVRQAMEQIQEHGLDLHENIQICCLPSGGIKTLQKDPRKT